MWTVSPTLPPGITNVSAEHKLTTNTPTADGLAVLWSGSLSGSYEVAPNYPRWWAYKCFVDLVTSRLPDFDGVVDKALEEILKKGSKES